MVDTILSDDIINSTELRNNQRHWLDKAYTNPISIMSGSKKLVLLNRDYARDMYVMSQYALLIVLFCQEQSSGQINRSNVFPWIKHLDEKAIKEFHKELLVTFDRATRSKDWPAFNEMIAAWKSTAEAMTNPEVVELLSSDLDSEEYTRVE